MSDNAVNFTLNLNGNAYDGIVSSIQKDDILRMSSTEAGAAFCGVSPLSSSDMELWEGFCIIPPM